MERPWIYIITIGVGSVMGWVVGQGPSTAPTLTGTDGQRMDGALPVMSPAAERGGSDGVALNKPEEMKARLEELLASPFPDRQAVQLLMAQWVAQDLESARAWVRSFPDDPTPPSLSGPQPVEDFFKAWAGLDPKAAMAEALAVGGEKSLQAQNAVITGLARADFATIQDVLTKVPDGKNNPRGAVAELLKQLMGRDRPAALALALALPGAMGEGAVQGIASVWARTEPGAALEWAQQHPVAGSRDIAVKIILKQWARLDPLAVGPMLLQKRDGQSDVFHTEAATEAVARLGGKSPEAAAQFVSEFYPQDQLKANLSSLFFRLMREDVGNPKSAAAMIAVVNVLPAETLANAKLWKNTWLSDLKPSWDQVLAEPDSPGRQFLLGEIGRKFASRNPTQLIQDAMKFPESAARDAVLKAALGPEGGFHEMPTREASDAFRKAVESMPEGIRGLGAAHLAWSLGAHDPLAATDVLRQYPAAAESKNLVENIAIRLTETMDLSRAGAWAASLPTAEAQGRGFSGIVSGYYSDDSVATSEWVRSLPQGHGRDSAASNLANYAREDDPEAALAWAFSIQDAKLRQDAAKGVIQSWATMDRSAAQLAVEQSSLPNDQKSALLNLFSSKP